MMGLAESDLGCWWMMVASDLSLCVLGWLPVLFASKISVLSSRQVMCASVIWLMSVCCAMMKSSI